VEKTVLYKVVLKAYYMYEVRVKYIYIYLYGVPFFQNAHMYTYTCTHVYVCTYECLTRYIYVIGLIKYIVHVLCVTNKEASYVHVG
jgi:hypothetical protein